MISKILLALLPVNNLKILSTFLVVSIFLTLFHIHQEDYRIAQWIDDVGTVDSYKEIYKVQSLYDLVADVHMVGNFNFSNFVTFSIEWNKALETVKDRPIRVYINSNGGQLKILYQIEDLITSSNVQTIGLVDVKAHSCAFRLLTLLNDQIVTDNAQMVIHSPFLMDPEYGKLLVPEMSIIDWDRTMLLEHLDRFLPNELIIRFYLLGGDIQINGAIFNVWKHLEEEK